MPRKHIVIAGAGIGGLTAALALAQSGHRVTILEQASAISAVGAGVTLSPNAMRVFRHLGIELALCETGIEPSRQRVQHWRDGRTLITLERGNIMRETYHAPYLYIHRADLHAALLARLAAFGSLAKIRLGSVAESASADRHQAGVTLRGGERISGDAVIAADGIKSRLRGSFSSQPAHFTGHIAWRAIIQVTDTVLAELASFPGVHIGSGRMAVRYPVKSGTCLNLVFFARQQGWAEEGWAIPADAAELATHFDGWSPEIAALRAAIEPGTLFKWGIFAHRPLPSWIAEDRIALLGDAAHAMTPFLGQGAACAIEDAMIIARCLDRYDDVPRALAAYEAARSPRCRFIQEESNANADRIQGPETELFGLSNLRNEETLGLFSYDAVTAEI